jgi:uncharacterized protein
MNKESIIKDVVEYVREKLENESSGHDWWHIYRVWKIALRIVEEEKDADLFIVQLAALLREVGDWKITENEDTTKESEELLRKLGIDENIIRKIVDIIDNISFSSNIENKRNLSLEGKIVQDADRLDAIGAIGIARCFAYGGCKGREIYNPNIKPKKYKSTEQYKKSKSPSINHFYEKLLLLKDLMNTETRKKIAEGRHKYMKQFLDRFFREWEGKD